MPGPQQTQSPLTDLRLAQQTSYKGDSVWREGLLLMGRMNTSLLGAELLPGRSHVITQTALLVPDKRPRLPGEGRLAKL